MYRIAFAASALVFSVLPAAAQNGAPDSEGGRYSFNRVDDGYLRLDQQTGQVSLCNRRSVGWACYPLPDERAALEEEIGRLQKDNAALKKEMLARGMTNREIAQELFVTMATVETHLGRAYRKLGIEGRSGLPDALGPDR